MINIQEKMRMVEELEKEGRKIEMLPIMKEIIDYIESINDEKWLISALNDYAGALRDTGSSDKAVELLKRARDLAEKHYGHENINYPAILSNLANSQRVNGDLDEAEKNFIAADELYSTMNAPKDLLAGNVHNLALLYSDKGDVVKCYELQNRELDMLRGDEQLAVPFAICAQNAASSAATLKEYDRAIELLKESEEIILKTQGEHSAYLGGIYNTMAVIMLRNDKFDECIESFNKALEVVERNYGKESAAYRSVSDNIEFARNLANKG